MMQKNELVKVKIEDIGVGGEGRRQGGMVG